MIGLELPNSLTSTYTYDEASRLTLLTHSALTQTLASYDYSLDNVGNRRALTEILISVQELANGAFLEENGLVVLEGEHGQRTNGSTHQWNLKTSQPGYTGTSYLQALPDLDTLYQTSDLTTSARVDFPIQFTTAETYTVWLRGYAANAAGDSIYVGLGEVITTVTGFGPGEWDWSNVTSSGSPATLPLTTTGVYTLSLWLREDGLRLDRLLLTTDTTYIPTGFGPPESDQQLGAGSLLTPLTRTIVYTYDNLYRLTEADYTSGENYQYEYDPVGNRLKQIIDGDTTDYLYDAANRLEQLNGQAVYTFDANGNLLESDVLTNTFDAANRLVETSRSSTTVEPIYNGVNDRVGQTVGVTTTNFALDVVGGLPEVIYTSENEAYLHLPGVIVTEKDGAVRYLLSDGLGSIRQAVDDTGAIIAYHEFDPYGNPTDNRSLITDYGYTGEWWQDEVELLHLRARWYDPGTGTFLSKDGWQGNELRPQSLNGWSYVEGNPILYIDPTGQCKGLTGKALEACNEAKEWLQRKTDRVMVDLMVKVKVVSNNCQMLVTSVRPRVGIIVDEALGLYDSGRGRARNLSGLDNRIDQSNPTIPFTNRGIPFSNVGEAVTLALLGESHSYLEGDAINLIRNDPAMIRYDQRLVNAAMSDPRYRQEAFTLEGSDGIQFGGDRSHAAPLWPDQFFDPLNPEYRATWDVASNELTWLIRSVGKMDTEVQVTKGGTLNIHHHFVDTLDLRPNRDPNNPDGQAYNAITTMLGFLYHDIGRGTEMKLEASWTSTHP